MTTLSSKIIRGDRQGNGRVLPLEMENFFQEVQGPPAIRGDMETAHCIDGKNDEIDIEEIKREAFESGFSEGKEAGMEMGLKEVEPVIERFIGSINELSSLKETLFKESENEISELVIAAAKKIVQTEIAIDGEVVASVIKNALKSLTDRKDIVIRVNPFDYYLILEHKKRMFAEVDGLKDVTFIEDESVGRGGCLIESRFGEVDARIETQLGLLEKAFRESQKV